MSQFLCKHQTKTRMRYECLFINKKTDIDALTIRLESLNGVMSAKINNKARTFTLYSDGSWSVKQIEKELSSIDFKSFSKQNKTPKSIINAHNPNTSGLLRSLTALALTPMIANNTLKFAVSALSSAPLFAKGTNDLIKSGLTSKVLEAMAVGVSLARKDYTAANSTNALLELGEYIEETTVQKSDELIKEL
ncbi:MAG: heavy metal translocating P-type ATPase, partial [Campylobacteraceae bacterium]|nr:heavy metal translocating P-type ATPase [Campylobacteraceae bacterium]